jgi:hypothetical protein
MKLLLSEIRILAWCMEDRRVVDIDGVARSDSIVTHYNKHKNLSVTLQANAHICEYHNLYRPAAVQSEFGYR